MIKRITIISKIVELFIFLIYNSRIPAVCTIGAGSFFAYGGIAVVIHKNAIIGKNCNIGTCVIIGGRFNALKLPVIGDNVFIATGAKILGDVTIGNNCVIGANAVVINDVPDNCVVAGVPAKIIKENINPKDYY